MSGQVLWLMQLGIIVISVDGCHVNSDVYVHNRNVKRATCSLAMETVGHLTDLWCANPQVRAR